MNEFARATTRMRHSSSKYLKPISISAVNLRRAACLASTTRLRGPFGSTSAQFPVAPSSGSDPTGNCEHQASSRGPCILALLLERGEAEARDGHAAFGTDSCFLPKRSRSTLGMVQQNADQAVHEAARAGLVDKLAAILARDVSLIDAKGIDARTPLHCAGTVAVAALLLDNGARIDARDEDHDSTPAQWRIGESPDVSQFLLERGAKADIFLATALGDLVLAQRLVMEDRGCLAH